MGNHTTLRHCRDAGGKGWRVDERGIEMGGEGVTITVWCGEVSVGSGSWEPALRWGEGS
jgi:hypothetical protein